MKKSRRMLTILLAIVLYLPILASCTTPKRENNGQLLSSDGTRPDGSYVGAVRIYDWVHPDGNEEDHYFSVTVPGFNDLKVERKIGDDNLYANGEYLKGGPGDGCCGFYLSDLTGDGYPELCFCMGWGSGIVDMRIEIIDYTKKESIFTLRDRMYHDYYLFLRDGVLCVEEKTFSDNEVVRTGVLSYNGTDVVVVWDEEVNSNYDNAVVTSNANAQ